MTREEIIRVARGAGLLRMTPIPDDSEFVAELERFATLVATHEREACAKIADKRQYRRVAAAIRARGGNNAT